MNTVIVYKKEITVMAKKFLTPEQAELKNIKKEANASCFTSFLAVLLSVAIAFGVVSMGKSTSEKLISETGMIVQTGDTNRNPDSSSSSLSGEHQLLKRKRMLR